MPSGIVQVSIAAVAFLVGVALVVESVETFVETVADASVELGVSSFFLTVCLAGTDLENAVLGLAAVTGDLPDVALGTVFGEALFILCAAVGVAGVLVPFAVTVPRSYLLLTIGSPLALVAFSTDGTLSRLEGGVLVAAFVLFLGVVYWLESRTETRFLAAEVLDEDVDDDDAGGIRSVVVAVLAVVGMTVGSELAVVGARDLLTTFGIPGLAFGATVMSFVASLEELFLTVEPVKRGDPHLAVGNVVGSTAFFVTANAGLIALVRPIEMAGRVVEVHWSFFFATLLVVLVAFARGRLTRPTGGLLLGGYVLYWVANYLP